MSNKISRRAALGLAGGLAVGAATVGLNTAEAARDREPGAMRQVDAAAAKANPWIRLPVVTANIGRDHLGARDAAIAAVRHADDTRPLVGWQEIGEGDSGEPPMIRDHFGRAYEHVFLGDPKSPREPISVPRPWQVIGHKKVFVHKGISGVTPSRWINEVLVQHESIPALQFVFMNTHYIAGAYVGPKRDSLKKYWHKHLVAHAQRIAERHDNQGLPVIWTADTNRPGYGTATGRAAEQAAFHNGIDRVDWIATGKVEIQLARTKAVPMHVDGHDARVAVLHIRLAG